MNKIFPHAQTLDFDAAEFALSQVKQQLKRQTWTYCSREDLEEARIVLEARAEHLWENGRKAEFQAMIRRTFGRDSVV